MNELIFQFYLCPVGGVVTWWIALSISWRHALGLCWLFEIVQDLMTHGALPWFAGVQGVFLQIVAGRLALSAGQHVYLWGFT